MARPKPDTLKAAPGLVSVRLQLAPADHAALRAVAGQAGKSMAIWCREWVIEGLNKADKKEKR